MYHFLTSQNSCEFCIVVICKRQDKANAATCLASDYYLKIKAIIMNFAGLKIMVKSVKNTHVISHGNECNLRWSVQGAGG